MVVERPSNRTLIVVVTTALTVGESRVVYMFSYSLATDHLQKTVFYYVDIVRLLFPAWSPDSGVFPFSTSHDSGTFSSSESSYASNVDTGVRVMLASDVTGNSGGPDEQALDVNEWTGNTSAFLGVVGEAAARVHGLVTSQLSDDAQRATGEVATATVILVVVLALSPVVFLLIHRMTLTIQNYALGLSKKTKELRREKKRSDTLLYQMPITVYRMTLLYSALPDVTQVGRTPTQTLQEGLFSIISLLLSLKRK